MDGWITIGTKIIDKMDDGLQKTKKKLEEFDKNNQDKANIEVKVDTSKAEKSINKVEKKVRGFKNTFKDYEAPEFIDEVSFDAQIIHLENKIKDIRNQIQNPIKFKLTTPELSELSVQEEKLTNQLINLKQKQQDFNGEVKKGKINVDDVGSSMSKVLKKVTKWGLAIFSVRSAYMFIRQAVSTISQYDDQIATDLDYIKYGLTTAIEPIIKRIISLVQTLLTYVNYIWKAWTGNNLFASAKAFESMKKSAKEINKQLQGAGFDEMQILQDNSSGDSGNANIPSFDLTDNDIPIPWWVDWIANNKETVLSIAGAIGGLFAASTVSKWLTNIGRLFGTANGTGLLGLSTTLGSIAAIAGGIVVTGYVAAEFIKDIQNLKEEISSIIDINSKRQHEWIDNEENIDNLIKTQNIRRASGYELLKKSEGIFGKITGLSKSEADAATSVVKNSKEILEQEMKIYKKGNLTYEQKKKLLGSLSDQMDYNEKIIEALDKQGVDTTNLVKINNEYKNNWRTIRDEVNNNISQIEDIDELNKKINDKISSTNTLFSTSGDLLYKITGQYDESLEKAEKIAIENQKISDRQMEIYKSGKLDNDEKEKLLGNLENQVIYNQKVIDKLKAQNEDTSKLEEINKRLKKNWEDIYTDVNGTKGKFDEINKTKLDNKTLNIDITAKDKTNNILETILKPFMKLFDKIKQTGGNIASKFKSAFGFAKGGLVMSSSYTGFAKGGMTLPKPIRCFQGSVISQPGRGVPISRAVGGEGGATGSHEGIVPLTDSQMMSQLGEEIGRWVSVPVTNIIKLDSRQIAKILNETNKQNNFAYNR